MRAVNKRDTWLVSPRKTPSNPDLSHLYVLRDTACSAYPLRHRRAQTRAQDRGGRGVPVFTGARRRARRRSDPGLATASVASLCKPAVTITLGTGEARVPLKPQPPHRIRSSGRGGIGRPIPRSGHAIVHGKTQDLAVEVQRDRTTARQACHRVATEDTGMGMQDTEAGPRRYARTGPRALPVVTALARTRCPRCPLRAVLAPAHAAPHRGPWLRSPRGPRSPYRPTRPCRRSIPSPAP